MCVHVCAVCVYVCVCLFIYVHAIYNMHILLMITTTMSSKTHTSVLMPCNNTNTEESDALDFKEGEIMFKREAEGTKEYTMSEVMRKLK